MNANISGKQIRIARYMKNPVLQQKDVIALLELQGIHMTKNIISSIEKGERKVSDIELLAFAKALNVSVLWLLGET